MAIGKHTGRAAAISTQLGPDVLLLERFTATSRLNEPFLISAVVAADPNDAAADSRGSSGGSVPAIGKLLYSPVTIAVEGEVWRKRWFHGLVFAIEQLEGAQDRQRYELTIRPTLAALAERSDIRYFQHQSVKEIVEIVLASIPHVFELKREIAQREYCVQYRESDFAFVSRLLEEEGLVYYFRHSAGRHTLVITDDVRGGKSPVGSVVWNPHVDHDEPKATLHSWLHRFSSGPTDVLIGSRHFLAPKATGAAKQLALGVDAPAGLEHYDFPASVRAYDEAKEILAGKTGVHLDEMAKSRLVAARAEWRRTHGEGNAFAFGAGDIMKVVGTSMDGEYLLTAVTHVFSAQSYRSGQEEDEQIDAFFEGVPTEDGWAPPLRTHKPLVGGPVTALVQGPKGYAATPEADTIHVDTHGRVKVRFYWDRQHKDGEDDLCSCWLRVSEGWASGAFGTVFLPRVGDEVIVSFMDGDPDQPLITGRVYNPQRTLPYALPDNKTISTIRTQTVGKVGSGYDETESPPKASEVGFNEIQFEDKGDQERIFIHAQREMETKVRRDDNQEVGRDRSSRIGRNRVEAIKKNLTRTIEEGDERRSIKKGSRQTTIEKDDQLTITSGNLKSLVSKGDMSLDVASGKATINAAKEILLKVGSSSLKMTPTGIELTAMTVTVDARMVLQAKAGMTAEVKAGIALTLNGMMVNIN